MVLTCTYQTDLGTVWAIRRVQQQHQPLVEGADDESEEVYPDDLLDLFAETDSYCRDYPGFRQRKLQITKGNSQYLVTLPVLVDSPEFLAIKDELLNVIGVDELEVIGERIPFPVLRLLV